MPVSEFKPGDLVTLKSGGPTMTFDRHIQSEGKINVDRRFRYAVRDAIDGLVDGLHSFERLRLFG